MIEKRFTVTNISENGNTGLFWLGKDNLSVYDVVRSLNELNDENQKLKEEIIEWKSKYFEAMDTVIGEYSTNIKEDMKKLEKEVWGDVE